MYVELSVALAAFLPTLYQVAQMLDAVRRSVFKQCEECLEVKSLFAAAPLRALPWLTTAGVVLLYSAEKQMLPLLPPISFAGGRQTKKRDHSASALDDDSYLKVC